MSGEVLDRIVRTRDAAHHAVTVGYSLAKMLLDDGKRVRITVAEDQDDISAKQRRFFHGPVLTQIAEQVRMPDGTRYVAAVWKTYFRALYLPDKWVMRKQPRWDKAQGRLVEPKRATPHRERQSTEDLGIKGYSDLIDKVTAHAATEFGVEFDFEPSERDGVRYVRPPRKLKAAEKEAVAA